MMSKAEFDATRSFLIDFYVHDSDLWGRTIYKNLQVVKQVANASLDGILKAPSFAVLLIHPLILFRYSLKSGSGLPLSFWDSIPRLV